MQWLYHFKSAARPQLAHNESAWTEADKLIATAHSEYLQRATDEGRIILAGRSQDGIGPAVVIFEAASAEEAAEFMRCDPFVREGLFAADIHPFRAAFMSGRDEIRPSQDP